MRIDFVDSPLRCPRSGCGKRMVLELGEAETDGEREHEARHVCLSCDYTEIETGKTKPLASTTGPILASIRDRIRDDQMAEPLEFEWPEEAKP